MPIVEREPRIVLNRAGNLSQTTQLNEEIADGFMKRSDMRRDIVIVDSDRKPEVEGVDEVVVGHGLLGLRGFRPLRDLTAIEFKPQSFHTLTRKGDYIWQQSWEVAIQERVIDDLIRKKGYIDRSDYEEQFLAALNKVVKQGVVQALFQEKLGWHDQKGNYVGYLLYTAAFPINVFFDSKAGTHIGKILWLGLLPILNIGANYISNRYIEPLQQLNRFLFNNNPPPLPPSFPNRNWKELWLPPFPIEKWIAGRRFLTRHGNQLVIPRQA